jgi:hypothetical protein
LPLTLRDANCPAPKEHSKYENILNDKKEIIGIRRTHWAFGFPCERGNIEEGFRYETVDPSGPKTERLKDTTLGKDWKIVATQNDNKDVSTFLCLDWAVFRLCLQSPQLRSKTENPSQDQIAAALAMLEHVKGGEGKPTDGVPVKDFLSKKLNGQGYPFELIKCDKTDKDRVAIAWQDRAKNAENPNEVGHISVKYNGNWESKLSAGLYVCCFYIR